jgi:hypothetical protein
MSATEHAPWFSNGILIGIFGGLLGHHPTTRTVVMMMMMVMVDMMLIVTIISDLVEKYKQDEAILCISA